MFSDMKTSQCNSGPPSPRPVAAGVPPAVEPGILSGGWSRALHRHFRFQRCRCGRQDAALYGSQDGCRYRSWRALAMRIRIGPRAVPARSAWQAAGHEEMFVDWEASDVPRTGTVRGPEIGARRLRRFKV